MSFGCTYLWESALPGEWLHVANTWKQQLGRCVPAASVLMWATCSLCQHVLFMLIVVVVMFVWFCLIVFVCSLVCVFVSLFFVCLLIAERASNKESLSQVLIYSGNIPGCDSETDTADQTCYFTQLQGTDTGPTSPSIYQLWYTAMKSTIPCIHHLQYADTSPTVY